MTDRANRPWHLLARPSWIAAVTCLVLVGTFAAALGGLGSAPTSDSALVRAAGGAPSCYSQSNLTGTMVYVEANVSSGPAPLTTTLCAFMGSPPTSGHWAFGDGTTSNGTNVSSQVNGVVHTYLQPGVYNATFNATFSGGRTGADAVQITVTSAHPITLGVSVSANPATGAAPLVDNLTTTITGGNGTTTFDLTAHLGNISVYTGPYTYNGTPNSEGILLRYVGTWEVIAAAQDVAGDTGTGVAYVAVTGTNATINGTGNSTLTPNLWTSNPYGAAPLTVTFGANASGGVAPYTYAWTFGDGTNATGQVVAHTYTSPGNYTASVNVTDAHGATAVQFANVQVVASLGNNSSGGIHVDFRSTLTTANVPFNSTFTVSATGGVAPYLVEVCPGDGNCANPLYNWSGAPTTFEFTYAQAGNFTATAVVTDADGNQSVATIPIEASFGSPLNVSVLESVAYGPAPLAVGFLATVIGGTAPYTIQWSWGDGSEGSSANGAVVAHAYTAVGVYSPSLRVTDSANHTETVYLGSVNVTGPDNSTQLGSKPTGLLPGGSGGQTFWEYAGVGGAAALVSGIGIGLLLRQRGRSQAAEGLARALEREAARDAASPPPPKGQR